jgi:hypothetical protein
MTSEKTMQGKDKGTKEGESPKRYCAKEGGESI